MNNFDRVFLSVKDCCTKSQIVESKHCFQVIAKAVRIPVDRLVFYLDTFESMGLLKYSIEKEYLKLTPYGEMKEKLFED